MNSSDFLDYEREFVRVKRNSCNSAHCENGQCNGGYHNGGCNGGCYGNGDFDFPQIRNNRFDCPCRARNQRFDCPCRNRCEFC